jgi:hypothetical protein
VNGSNAIVPKNVPVPRPMSLYTFVFERGPFD